MLSYREHFFWVLNDDYFEPEIETLQRLLQAYPNYKTAS